MALSFSKDSTVQPSQPCMDKKTNIAHLIHAYLNDGEHTNVEQIESELDQVLNQTLLQNEQVKKMQQREAKNYQMDVEYKDKPEPMVLMLEAFPENEPSVQQSDPKFAKSKQVYEQALQAQHDVIEMFEKKNFEPGNFEMKRPIRLVYEDERPSTQDIERARGDQDTALTRHDRAVQQVVQFMNKFSNYVQHIKTIRV